MAAISYTLERDNIITFLDKYDNEKNLTEKQKLFLENNITKQELCFAVQNLKNNKSPGLDGLTPEFYKKFWKILEDFFFSATQEIFQEGQLTESMKKSILSLLFKNGKKNKRELLEHYRPLTLSNYDYKIIAFSIANRLKKVLPSLINKDQSAYIDKRYIGNNARFLIDLIEYADENQIGGLLICVDFRKAFDSLNWNFMIEVLKKLNFGPSFINMIKTLYANPTIQIKNNGHFSKEIKIEKGVKQGCPVSAMIFTLCVEYLTKAINKNKDIEGIEINKEKTQNNSTCR